MQQQTILMIQVQKSRFLTLLIFDLYQTVKLTKPISPIPLA